MTTGSKLRAAAALVLVVGSTYALADTVQLNPSKDNTLYEDDAGQTSNGQGMHFFVGRTGRGLRRRGLIAFDFTSIPAGSTIQRVTLTLHVSMAPMDPPEVEIDLRPVLRDWGEGDSVADGTESLGAQAAQGDATWLHTFYDTQFWTLQAGDFASTLTSSAAVSGIGFYTFDSALDRALVDNVQQWLDQSSTNFGWGVLVADEYFPLSAKRFDTRENSNPDYRPMLTVTYAAPSCP